MSTIEDFRKMSEEIDSLFTNKNLQDCKILIQKAIAESKGVSESYHNFFQSEYASYILGDSKKDYKYMLKAVQDGDDWFLLLNMGISLFNVAKFSEAGVYLAKSLTLEPNNIRTLCYMGQCRAALGNDDAIIFFERAKQIDSESVFVLKELGECYITLEKFKEAIELYAEIVRLSEGKDTEAIVRLGFAKSLSGAEEDAIKSFKNALKFDPEDCEANYGIAVSMWNLKNFDEAFTYIEKAFQLDKEDHGTRSTYQYISGHMGKPKIDYKANGLKVVATEKREEELNFVRGQVARVWSELPDSEDLVSKIESAKGNRKKFIFGDNQFDNNQTLLFVLRRWNSYTPILPEEKGLADGISGVDEYKRRFVSDSEKYVGGGYFLWHAGRGTVIDPGYNFIENFHSIGGRLCNINNIIITHAHNDHTNDFESILSLAYQYNEKIKKTNGSDQRKINIYMNTGSFMKFSGLIDLNKMTYIDRIHVIEKGLIYDTLCEGVKLSILPAYHNEIVSSGYAVGLMFDIDFKGQQRKILLTSDTGLFPPLYDEKKRRYISDTDQKPIWEQYGLKSDDSVDVLIAHIGSVKDSEFNRGSDVDLKTIFYPNHLGILGTSSLVATIKPNLAIISEFGEELQKAQPVIMELLSRIMQNLRTKKGDKVCVLPGDLPLIVNIEKDQIYCVRSDEYVAFEGVVGEKILPETPYYYYSTGKWDKHATLLEAICEFEKAKKEHTLPYFNPKIIQAVKKKNKSR